MPLKEDDDEASANHSHGLKSNFCLVGAVLDAFTNMHDVISAL